MRLLVFIISLMSCPNLLFDGGEFYKGQGVVFSSLYEARFLKPSFRRPVVLSGCQIEKAESILLSQLDDSFSRHPNLEWNYSKTPKEVFWNYNRQYYGYERTSRDTIVVINLLNFAKKRKAKKLFAGWKSEFIIGSGGDYEKNMLTIKVDVTNSILVLDPND